MSKYAKREPRRYAVARQWSDKPDDVQVIEYFASVEECEQYIEAQPEDTRKYLGIGEYT